MQGNHLYFRAPTDCVQYFTGVAGSISSYNHEGGGTQLSSQNYNLCIRQEQGEDNRSRSIIYFVS